MNNRKKILFICGSNNQTTMMHKIGMHLNEYDLYYTPYYCDGFLRLFYKAGLLDFTVIGKKHRQNAVDYFSKHSLKPDYEGRVNQYDLVITSSDLLIQKNIKGTKIILVQEGMTDPENILYYASKYLGLPRWLASTSATGLSDAYQKFCVASAGYARHFVKKGVNPEKIAVTGIPNFDNVSSFITNDFPYSGYVLAATSDSRETFKPENRIKFIKKCLDIADVRELIFKLHPNENTKRAIREIRSHAPGSAIYTAGNINHMIANCDVLITKYSTVVYTGLALGKEVYSDFNLQSLKQMIPIQNCGTSGVNIANICRKVVEEIYDTEPAQINREIILQQGGLSGEAA